MLAVYDESLDKSKWGDGPWQTEPDKKIWRDQATGYACLIWRNPLMGNLCGYVGVRKSHPWFGKDYCEWEADGSNLLDVPVHGGLTFSGSRPDLPGLWFFGFDCAHAGDLVPICADLISSDVYRDINYCTRECETLARVLQQAANS